MIKILHKVELGAKKSNEEFDAELNKLWELPVTPNQYTAVVHLNGKQFYVVYESDSLFDPKTFVAGDEQELMEAVAKS